MNEQRLDKIDETLERIISLLKGGQLIVEANGEETLESSAIELALEIQDARYELRALKEDETKGLREEPKPESKLPDRKKRFGIRGHRLPEGAKLDTERLEKFRDENYTHDVHWDRDLNRFLEAPLSNGAMSGYISGRARPSIPVAKAIAKSMGIDDYKELIVYPDEEDE